VSKSNPCRNPTISTDQSGRRWGKGKKKQESGAEARGGEAFLATGGAAKRRRPIESATSASATRQEHGRGQSACLRHNPGEAPLPLRPHLLPSVLSLSLSLSPCRVAAINTSCRRLLPSHLQRQAHTDTHTHTQAHCIRQTFAHAPL
jgi:hypothetical protein